MLLFSTPLLRSLFDLSLDLCPPERKQLINGWQEVEENGVHIMAAVTAREDERRHCVAVAVESEKQQ